MTFVDMLHYFLVLILYLIYFALGELTLNRKTIHKKKPFPNGKGFCFNNPHLLFL